MDDVTEGGNWLVILTIGLISIAREPCVTIRGSITDAIHPIGFYRFFVGFCDSQR